jgi:hypothetical protein
MLGRLRGTEAGAPSGVFAPGHLSAAAIATTVACSLRPAATASQDDRRGDRPDQRVGARTLRCVRKARDAFASLGADLTV